MPNGVRLGAQTPRVRNAPPYVKTYGDQVIDFMAQVGRPLDPWQAEIVLDAFGVQEDGLWSAYELLLLLSRQNGKGGLTEAIELAALYLFREPLILHSAHQFKTASAALRRLADIVEGSDWLRKRTKRIVQATNEPGIYLTREAGGGSLQFVARSLGSGRGLTGSKNIFDEAWALTIGQFAAQTPTLATLPNPQIIYTTTPPDEQLGPVPEDAMLPSVRRRAMAGSDRVAVYEWSPPEKFDRTDRDVWYDCNPALGIRISEWFLAKQLNAFTDAGKPEKFDTEHLGVWPIDGAQQWQVIAAEQWQAAADVADEPVLPVSFGVEVDWDRSHAAVAVAWRRADGLRQVEITQGDDGVDHRPGTGWVVPRVKELMERWQPSTMVIDVGGPAGSLIKELEDAEIGFEKMTTADAGRAYGWFRDGISDPDVAKRDMRHGNQPALNAAVAGAVERELGTARAWDRKLSRNFSPLGAATAALWMLPPDYDVLSSVY